MKLQRIALAIALTAGSLAAQTITGTILGDVKDPTGAAVAGAEVTVANAGTNQGAKTVTNALGYYEAPYLKPGTYTVRVAHPGFKTAVRDGVPLEVDNRLRLDFSLEVGDVTTAVDVTAQAPLIDTETGSLGYVVSNRTVEEMPLQGRNVFDMVSLAAGVQENPTATGGVASPGSFYFSDFSMNGGRMRTNEYLLDGVSIMLPQNNNFAFAPSPDSTLQFKIMTSNYGPQFGRTGGGTVNVLTKGGTNELHGTLYEFHRDHILRANNYFANARGQKRGVYTFNMFGASVGGPIVRNRTFFYADYQGHRQYSALGGRVLTLPGAAERTGDFSHRLASNGQPITIYNPFSLHKVGTANVRDPFPGNIISPALFDPVAKKVLTYVPQPNLPGDGPAKINNYAYAPASYVSSNQWSGRIDHRFSDTNSIFGRVTRSTSATTGGGAFGTIAGPDSGNDYLHNINVVLNDTWTMSPRRILSLRYGFTRSLEQRIPLWEGKVNLTDLGFPAAISAAAQDQVFPLFTINGLSTFGNPTSNRIRLGNDIHTWVAEQTQMLGRHTLVYGADIRLYNQTPFQAGVPSGSYSFTQGFTQNVGQSGLNVGDGLASFLVGYGSGGSIDAAPAYAIRNWYTGLFVNDDIRLQRLTINAGLRWDYEQPRTERYNRFSVFEFDKPFPIPIPSLPNLMGTVGSAGRNGVPRGNFESTYKDFGPRVGMAYRLDAHTVIRAGYGIFFLPRIGSTNAAVFGTVGSNTTTTWVPSIDGITLNTPLSNPFPNGLLQPATSLADQIAVGQTFRINNRANKANSYSQQWNFSVQRSLWREAAASITYAGSQGVRLPDAMLFNQVNPIYLSLGTVLNARVDNPFYGLAPTGVVNTSTVARYQMLRPYPQYNNIQTYMENIATSKYHSMLLQFEKRFSRGYNLMVNYTVSKLIDNGSSRVVNYTAYEPFMQNTYDLRNERSLSIQDVPQRVVVSHTLQIPGGRYRFTKGWNLVGTFTWNRGFPLALTATGSNTYLFNPATRPNNNGHSAVLSGRVEDHLLKYFDTSAFSVPPLYTFGNVARTLPDVRSPSRWNDNLAISKTMKLTERFSLLIRAESFNLTNTPFFDVPATTLGAGTFGIISSSRNERQLQGSAKILF